MVSQKFSATINRFSVLPSLGYLFSGLSLLSITGLIITASVPQSKAGRIEPIPTRCWFLKEEKIKLRQTCIYSSFSWTGGRAFSLKWEDGVTTAMAAGLVGRGEKPCGDDYQIDGNCGVMYYRHPKTMRRLPNGLSEEKWKEVNGENPSRCIQAKGSKNSVCWVHPY
jgi:hypothetical protein